MTDQPTTLPVLVPSAAATTAAGRHFAGLVDPRLKREWDEAPRYVRHHYQQTALDLLNAAAPHLLADVLEHLVVNHAAFGLSATTVDQLLDAGTQARATLGTSPIGWLPEIP
jgi:hypothetical protein